MIIVETVCGDNIGYDYMSDADIKVLINIVTDIDRKRVIHGERPIDCANCFELDREMNLHIDLERRLFELTVGDIAFIARGTFDYGGRITVMTDYDEIAENLSVCYCLEIRYDHESHSFVMVHDDGREETVCGADADLLEIVQYLDSLDEE